MSGFIGTRDFNCLWNEKKTFIPHSHNIISIQIHRHSQPLQPQMPSPPYAFSKEKHEKSYSWGHRRNLQWYLGPRISLGSKEAWKVPDALKSCSSFPQLDHWWNRHQANIRICRFSPWFVFGTAWLPFAGVHCKMPACQSAESVQNNTHQPTKTVQRKHCMQSTFEDDICCVSNIIVYD